MNAYEELRQKRMDALSAEQRSYFELTRRPSLRELGVEAMREKGRQIGGVPTSDPSVSCHDEVIDGPHGAIPVRIFQPSSGTDGPRGIYLHIHAGGFVMMGGLDTMTNANIAIAKSSGCIVVAPDFRLPPEHRYPVPLDDCMASFKWTAENAARLGGRSDRICIGGGCTGGNLATVVALMARDEGGPIPAAQYLYATVFDMRSDYRSHWENDSGYTLSHDDCMYVYEQYLEDPDSRWDWRVSPILAPSLKGLPPTLIRVGEWDVLRDESRAYADRLRDAGVDVTYHEVRQESHGIAPYHMVEAQAEMNDFLARHLCLS